MNKKLLFVFAILFSLFLYSSAHAFIAFPFFNITINKVAVGGDDNFNFHILATPAGNALPYLNDQFSVQTESGTGSSLYSHVTGDGDHYYLTENSLEGWKNTDVTCSSNNPNVTTSFVNGRLAIIARQYSSIECTFTNTKQVEKTPVLIVPGILGTNLEKDGGRLWLDLNHNLIDVGDQFMDPLQFKNNLTPIDTNLIVGDVVGKPSTFYNYTDGLIKDLQSQGYTEGESATSTLFTFPYDWRYGVTGNYPDGKTNVDLLQQKIEDIKTLTGSDKVDIIAHSTGGLIVKKYIENNLSGHSIDKAVFVGVPNLGAPKAVKTLLQGDNFGIPFLADEEMKKISANLPVAYELAPSESYVTNNGSYIKIFTYNFPHNSEKDLSFSEVKDFLVSDHGLNSLAVTNAVALHSSIFDYSDPRNAGVDAYSIVGCKSGTLSTIKEFRKNDGQTVLYQTDDTTGDGTVPMTSAESLPVYDDHLFYAPKVEHGKMLSADGVRQKIVNIITGGALPVGGKVISKPELEDDPTQCELHGHWFGIFSPVSIAITDEVGNHAGLASDGSIQNDIPGADYQIMGEHKFIFLPDDAGQTYTIGLTGTGDGTFTFKDQKIDGGQPGETQAFVNIPVTQGASGGIAVGEAVGETVLSFDTNHDGNPEIIPTSAILNSEQSQDVTLPISTSTISGVVGSAGFYRSDVTVRLSASDPVVSGQESNTSGVLETKYNLDGAGFQMYSASMSILISTEGLHTLKFFSTDKAGNNEQEQIVTFKIDKTAPTIKIISPVQKDYLRSDSIVVNATSSDNFSGVSMFGLAFDTRKVKNTDAVDLFYEKLGDHSFFASSTDFAGNAIASSTQFRIIATPASLISDIERAYTLGWITNKSTRDSLILQVKASTIIVKKLGNNVPALDKILGKLFLKELAALHPKYVNGKAYTLLTEDTNWLINN
ncbi:MAG: hypothetical protein V4467_01830 [Patescibacteria group bacterium]